MRYRALLGILSVVMSCAFGVASAADGSAPASQAGRNEGEVRTTENGRWSALNTVYGSDLVGADVVNGDGDQIGEIQDILIYAGGSKPDIIAVLSLSEHAGLGGREVVIQLANLEVQQRGLETDELRAMVRMSREELGRLPTYEER